MCDYALNGIPSRIAVEGERLVTYRYPSGSVAFVSESGLAACLARPVTLWRRIRGWFHPENPPSICLPPGATLIIRELPDELRIELGALSDEVVSVAQSGSPVVYRDAIRFRCGTAMLVQKLPAGQVADVLSLSGLHESGQIPLPWTSEQSS